MNEMSEFGKLMNFCKNYKNSHKVTQKVCNVSHIPLNDHYERTCHSIHDIDFIGSRNIISKNLGYSIVSQ
jgi:hypothetical protein